MQLTKSLVWEREREIVSFFLLLLIDFATAHGVGFWRTTQESLSQRVRCGWECKRRRGRICTQKKKKTENTTKTRGAHPDKDFRRGGVPRVHVEAWLHHVELLYVMVCQREMSIRAMKPTVSMAMPPAPSSAFGDSGNDDGAFFGASMSRVSSRDTGPSSFARDSTAPASSSRRRRRT